MTKRKTASQSVSVPMTLSDLDRRDLRWSIISQQMHTLVWFDLEWPNLAS